MAALILTWWFIGCALNALTAFLDNALYALHHRREFQAQMARLTRLEGEVDADRDAFFAFDTAMLPPYIRFWVVRLWWFALFNPLLWAVLYLQAWIRGDIVTQRLAKAIIKDDIHHSSSSSSSSKR